MIISISASVARWLMMQSFGAPHEIAIALFFLSGLVMMIIAGAAAEIVWRRQKKRFQREAEKSGLKIDFEEGKYAVDPYTCEGWGYCLLLIIIFILGAVGISLPILLPLYVENLITLIVLLIFGGFFWGIVIWAIYYIAKIPGKYRKKLDEAYARQA